MPQTPHIEKHFMAGDTIRDIVIGMSDGLTVPFASAAGLSGSVSSTALIVTAGLAEIAAGSIAMGLGGYLAARSDAQHYDSELRREDTESRTVPDIELQEIIGIFCTYGVSEQSSRSAAAELMLDPVQRVNFMMRFELGLEKPEARRAMISAATIGGSYIAGGIIPLLPYILIPVIVSAQAVSVIATLIALLIFGYGKARLTGAAPIRGALQTALVGGLAAGIAFLIAKAIS